jgi:hypothetical protein
VIPVGLILEDATAPRTAYYDRLLQAVRRNPRFRRSGARLLVPAEDTAQETNWPRFGDRPSAYLRGSPHDLSEGGAFSRYLDRIAAHAAAHGDQSVLVVNMHPFVRLPLILRGLPNVLIADGCLAGHERSFNPRTISMPALPMVKPATGAAGAAAAERGILASFQGADSHPVRRFLAELSGTPRFVVRLVDSRERYSGRIDALAGKTDPEYEALLDRSVFAFVARGDALFSYRLLEVMARGAIPIILSDGWVLPFDRLIDWESTALRFHHDAVPQIPSLLEALTPDEIAVLQAGVRFAYSEYLSDLDRIAEAMFAEAELILGET